MKKNKIIKALLAFVICLAMVQPAAAEDIKGEIGVSEGCKVEESFEVTVSYTGADFSRVDAYMEYNADEIRYISGGSSTGNSGMVQLKEYADENGDIEFTLKFEGKAAGDTALKLVTNELYSFDEVYLEAAVVEKTITVEEAEEEVVEEEVDSVDSVEEEVNQDEDFETEVVEEEIEDKTDVPSDTYLVFGIVLGVLVLALLIVFLKRKK